MEAAETISFISEPIEQDSNLTNTDKITAEERDKATHTSSFLQKYFQEISKYALLSPEEERAIAERIKRRRETYALALLRIPYVWVTALERNPIKKNRSKKNPVVRNFDIRKWKRLHEANSRTIDALLRKNIEDFRRYSSYARKNPGYRSKKEEQIAGRIARRIRNGARLISELGLDIIDIKEIESIIQEQNNGASNKPNGRNALLLLGLPTERYNPKADYELLERMLNRYLRLIDRTRESYIRALQTLVNHNLRLVVNIAKKYKSGLPSFDLIGEGNIGLMMAAERFEPGAGCKFSTYAIPWIKQRITRAAEKTQNPIYIPEYKIKSTRDLHKRRANPTGNGKHPSIEELAEATGKPERVIEEELSLLHMMGYKPSLDASPTIKSSVPRYDTTPSQEVERMDLAEWVRKLIGELPERERIIIKMRFGIPDGYIHTLEEVGKRLGLTRERVRQLQEQAIGELREMKAAKVLGEYLSTNPARGYNNRVNRSTIERLLRAELRILTPEGRREIINSGVIRRDKEGFYLSSYEELKARMEGLGLRTLRDSYNSIGPRLGIKNRRRWNSFLDEIKEGIEPNGLIKTLEDYGFESRGRVYVFRRGEEEKVVGLLQALKKTEKN